MSQQVTSSVNIALPREQCWNKLRDLTLAHNYVPGLVKTELVSEIVDGVGASRYVYRSPKSYIQETVTEWQEGEGFLIRLHKGDQPAPPFKDAWFRYHLADAGDSATTFTASMGFELPWGVFGSWLEKRLLGFVQKTIDDVALSMKRFYETGEPTTPAALKAAKQGR